MIDLLMTPKSRNLQYSCYNLRMKITKPIIVLASKSPRRKELLKKTGINFKIAESGLKEHFDSGLAPHKIAEKLSFEKAVIVVQKFQNAIIISADTLVAIDNKVLGKPKNENDAIRMLGVLNGRMHQVITGFTVYDSSTNKFVTKSISSKVYFNKVFEREIINYVMSRKPLDKAGAYGIQELPEVFIKKIEGDYDNVIGLPVNALIQTLEKFGIKTT
jgi:septum formation protein